MATLPGFCLIVRERVSASAIVVLQKTAMQKLSLGQRGNLDRGNSKKTKSQMCHGMSKATGLFNRAVSSETTCNQQPDSGLRKRKRNFGI